MTRDELDKLFDEDYNLPFDKWISFRDAIVIFDDACKKMENAPITVECEHDRLYINADVNELLEHMDDEDVKLLVGSNWIIDNDYWIMFT